MVNFEELKNIYNGKRVFLTGHTGFKGSWLAEYLKLLGAEVYGYALAPNTEPSHFALLESDYHSTIGDIRDYDLLKKSLLECQADIVFHLAAQPLVRYSYRNPLETYEVNVMGSANLLNATRELKSCQAFINVTTDKCYENVEKEAGYKEEEPMGGHDPYSSSKGCSELVTASFRNSFFNLDKYGIEHNCLVASGRAGNVIGGGDWSEDRLIPDFIRAITSGEKLKLRNPKATRPWQHVLEPLTGYIMLGANLLKGDKACASGFNFGPNYSGMHEVEEVVLQAKKHWDKIEYEIVPDPVFHEANLLKLDSTKAKELLGWEGTWDQDQTVGNTIEWYKEFYENKKIRTHEQIENFIKDCFNG